MLFCFESNQDTRDETGEFALCVWADETGTDVVRAIDDAAACMRGTSRQCSNDR